MNAAQARTAEIVERTLNDNPAFKRLDENLFIVKQGSTYVMVNIVPLGEHRAQVRCVAQLVKGVAMNESLAVELLQLNARLRFGAFAYEPKGQLLLLVHSLLGGDTLDADELTTSLADVAKVADEYDDQIIARYGGSTMQELLSDTALAHLFNDSDTDAFK